jgi:prepilin-type N-terminal cleavage/methylation domain-containing protein
MHPFRIFPRQQGFSAMEILIVVAIIAILGTIVLASVHYGRDSSLVTKAGEQQKLMAVAIQLYYTDMGFYPPDVNRGWDPGLMQPLPLNPDMAAGETVPSGYNTSGTDCSHCPSNWQTVVAQRWKGPYMPEWSRSTPWGGKWDYNYWPETNVRAGCTLPAGVYVGIQGDYYGNNNIPAAAEQRMINNNFDAEQCINGESQMLLWPL